jgi:hypothetical protein
MRRFLIACLFVSLPLGADTVVIQPRPRVHVLPPDTATQDYMRQWMQQQHEKELQRKQQEHDGRVLEAMRPQPAPPTNADAPAEAELIAALMAAARSPEMYTKSAANGRLWRILPTALRTFYVGAMMDGLLAQSGMLPESYRCAACRLDEAIQGVTAFYDSDPAFAVIPISYALQGYARRARGDDPALIAVQARGYLAMLAAGPQTASGQP